MLRVLIFITLALLWQAGLADAQDLMSLSRKTMDKAMDYVTDPVQFNEVTTEEALKQSKKALSDLNTNVPVTPSMPKLDLLNISAPAIDITKLAQQGQDLIGSIDEQTTRYESQILVFVSASMPDTTVKNYLHQTQGIGAALVFRGLVNDSMKDMRLYLSKIIDKEESEHKLTLLIDPTLFERFDIKQVPAIVVTESEIKPCQAEGCPTPVYHKVGGDVSLAWALGLVSRQIDSDELKATLRPLIKDMENR